MRIEMEKESMPYEDPLSAYRRETDGGNTVSLLMQSRRRDMTYGTKSVLATRPGVQILGKNNHFEIHALNPEGAAIVGMLAGVKFLGAETQTLESVIVGEVQRSAVIVPEEQRIRQPSLATIIRQVLSAFEIDDPDAGLYGAFAYDFARQFERIGSRFADAGGPDINLFLPGEVMVFDDIRQLAVRKRYLFSAREPTAVPSPVAVPAGKREHEVSMGDEEYMRRVGMIIEDIKRGEMIQAVFSRTESVSLQRHPLASYADLIERNPSPYCFFFNMGGEVLFGASPELHVRVQGDYVEIRPLAGTARRTGHAVDDHEAWRALVNDEKERREHVMLVDLARNDIGRVCINVAVREFMGIVAFPNIYHIGSSVTGTLEQGRDGLDAILATLPAGTLSGAPKVRAMQAIEELEADRRGYYGGCIGMVGFNGDCNTGITIRSVHVRDGRAYVQAGGGIVHHSVPEKELAEVALKSRNQLAVLGG